MVLEQLCSEQVIHQETRGVSCDCYGGCVLDKKKLCSQVKCVESAGGSDKFKFVKVYSTVTGRQIGLKICKKSKSKCCKRKCKRN